MIVLSKGTTTWFFRKGGHCNTQSYIPLPFIAHIHITIDSTSVGLLYLKLLIFTSLLFSLCYYYRLSSWYLKTKENTVCSDYNLLSCQQYIHTFNTDGSVNKYTYLYLTCDIQLTVYTVSIAIATITSVNEFKIVKRFQTLFYNT
jgi:hypothetical protein